MSERTPRRSELQGALGKYKFAISFVVFNGLSGPTKLTNEENLVPEDSKYCRSVISKLSSWSFSSILHFNGNKNKYLVILIDYFF